MTAAAPAAPAFSGPFEGVRPEPVALKVQRRKYANNAIDELEIRRRIGDRDPASHLVMACAEVFMHDGHICQVYPLHGSDTHSLLKRGPLPLEDVKLLTRQVLEAIRVMHEAGLIHSDIKPGNVLWCGRRREARLIDFGNAAPRIKQGSAIGTQDYCPPEMLLGNPMEAPVDLWALGCTVFEWLTGFPLFDPWEACSRKYEEFGPGDGDADEAPGASDEDDLEEEREQLPPGFVLAGKYRLLEEIGRGKCATVWRAEPLHASPLRDPAPTRDEARALAEEFRKPKPAPEGYNVYEVVQGHEHLLLMQEILGPIPQHLGRTGRYRDLFYGPDGGFRFGAEIKPTSLRERLENGHGFTGETAREIESFLLGLLQFEPSRRLTAAEALTSDWLRGVR